MLNLLAARFSASLGSLAARTACGVLALVLALALGLTLGLVTLPTPGAAQDPDFRSPLELAQAPQAPSATADDADADADEDEDPVKAAARYRVPDTKNPAELLRFIVQLREFEPRTVQSFLLHERLGPPAMREAAERALKSIKDKNSTMYKMAEHYLLVARAEMLSQASPAEQRELYTLIRDRLAKGQLAEQDIYLAILLTGNLEDTENHKLAVEAYDTFSKLLLKSQDKDTAEAGQQFAGAARRLQLVGNPMALAGRPIRGKAFDPAAYRGKVVLVDFWATWCAPCVRDLPKLKRLWRLYHDRGFEIIGISVDEDLDTLSEFVTQQQVPWVTLADHAPDNKLRMESQYGVVRFPTTILIGKDGKVISVDARTGALPEMLAKLLGPPPAGADADDDEPRSPPPPKADP